MNASLTATEQRYVLVKLLGMHADHEVRFMAKAGLVDASFNDGKLGSFASINRVTPAGEASLNF